MAAGTFDFTIEQGATFLRSFNWKDSNGSAVNLTGYTARMQIRRSAPSPDVLLSLTTENGRISITPLTGTVTLLVSATDTAAITWTSGKYDLELVASDGTVTRLLEGSVRISKEITRG